MAKRLTARQQAFVYEYVQDYHATRAAIRAGYSKDSAYSIGSENLKKPEISKAITQLIEDRYGPLIMSRVEVLARLSILGRSNIMDHAKVTADGLMDVDFSKLTRDQAYAIQELVVDTTGGAGDGERRRVLRTRCKLADRKGPLELLGKHYKEWTDRLEIKDELSRLSDEELAKRIAELSKELGVSNEQTEDAGNTAGGK